MGVLKPKPSRSGVQGEPRYLPSPTTYPRGKREKEGG